MPQVPAAPERRLESQRRPRTRRLATAFGRRGAVVLVAAMTLGAGGAAAHGTSHAARAAQVRGSGVTTKAIQRALGIRADGVFGPKTRRAVKRFQRRHGLAVDGVVGPATRAALGLTARPATVKRVRTRVPAVLEAIAACESGGNPAAVSSSGVYRGKYQFTRETWAALGGDGDPAAASEAEQDRIAGLLYAREGTSPWPACGAAL